MKHYGPQPCCFWDVYIIKSATPHPWWGVVNPHLQSNGHVGFMSPEWELRCRGSHLSTQCGQLMPILSIGHSLHVLNSIQQLWFPNTLVYKDGFRDATSAPL